MVNGKLIAILSEKRNHYNCLMCHFVVPWCMHSIQLASHSPLVRTIFKMRANNPVAW